MSKFKIGDKVRCVEASQGQWIEEGETYTVKNVHYWSMFSLRKSLNGTITTNVGSNQCLKNLITEK